MKKKYELTDNCIEWFGHKLYQIRALDNFSNEVDIGTLGGYIESESNLSQEDGCWIFDNVMVMDNALIERNAKVRGSVIIMDNAVISDYSEICGDLKLGITISDNVRIEGCAKVSGAHEIFDHVKIFDSAIVSGGCTTLCDRVKISGHAEVSGCFELNGDTVICGDAIIRNDSDFAVIRGFGSDEEMFFLRSRRYNIAVFCEWGFIGINEFKNKIRKKYRKSNATKDYIMLAEVMERKLGR